MLKYYAINQGEGGGRDAQSHTKHCCLHSCPILAPLDTTAVVSSGARMGDTSLELEGCNKLTLQYYNTHHLVGNRHEPILDVPACASVHCWITPCEATEHTQKRSSLTQCPISFVFLNRSLPNFARMQTV